MMTKDEMLAYVRELTGPDADLRVLDEADEVVDGVHHRCVAVEAVWPGSGSEQHGRSKVGGARSKVFSPQAKALIVRPATPPLIVRPATSKDEAVAEANPSWQTWGLLAGGAVVAGGVTWYFTRRAAAARLTDMLASSATVQKAIEANLIDWTPQEKAAELVNCCNMTSADQAFGEILAEVSRLLPVEESDVVDLSDDVLRVVQEKTGVDLLAVKTSVAGYLPSWLTGGG